jgi:hypothetical protein
MKSAWKQVTLTMPWNRTGSKATLITRLQEFDRENSIREHPQPPQQPVVTQQVRHASTVETPIPEPITEVPGVPSSSQPSPIPPSYPVEFLDVKLPDTALPTPEPQIAVVSLPGSRDMISSNSAHAIQPFVPDLWDSSRIKAESAPAQIKEPSAPKVMAVAGSETASDISHNLYPDVSAPSTSTEQVQRGFLTGLLHDFFPVTANIKLPAHEIPAALLEGVAETTQTSGKTGGANHSRTLDRDEKTGVLAVVGLIAGSWLLAGFFKPEPAFADKAHDGKAGHEKAVENH